MKMEKLLLKVESSDPDYDADIVLATLEMDETLAKLILGRRKRFLKAKEEDNALYEMYFWDSRVVFYEAPDIKLGDHDKEEELYQCRDEVIADVNDKEQMDWPEELDFEALHLEPARMECDQMVVRGDEVFWTAIPKHTSIYISTVSLQMRDLEKMLGGRRR